MKQEIWEVTTKANEIYFILLFLFQKDDSNGIETLDFNNNKLNEKNSKLTKQTNDILEAIKKFFRRLLQEDELFDYVVHHRYYGVPKYKELDDDYKYNGNKDDDFGFSL